MDLLGKIFKRQDQNLIFVQILSYRDPLLVSTLKDLFYKASKPDNLRVYVLNQWHPDDNIDLSDFKDDSRVEIMSSESNLSEGVCWARNIINKKYSSEKYTLQINSHHKFIRGWDTELINMLDRLIEKGHKKPILTTYVPKYPPTEGIRTPLYKIGYKEITKTGDIITTPILITNKPTNPTPTQFLSGNFIFTLGRFCQDVPYNPEIYFNSEEITMAIRAYTSGYDLFTPHKIILWDENLEEGSKKHQDNHGLEGFEFRSNSLTKKLLEMDGEICSPCLKKRMGEYFLGSERTLYQYEEFAGIHFKNRSATTHTIDNLPPPGPKSKGEFKSQFYERQHYKMVFPVESLQGHVEFDFWAIILLDEKNVEIHRQDLDKFTVDMIIKSSKSDITVGGSYKGRPYTKWIVWPHKDKWLNRINGKK